MKRFPLSFTIPAALGAASLLVGGVAMAGSLEEVHPLLNFDGGLALIVSGIALVLTGAFPLAIRMLTAKG